MNALGVSLLSPGKSSSLGELLGHAAELDVRLLRGPDEQGERVVGVEVQALHQDAFGLADQIA